MGDNPTLVDAPSPKKVVSSYSETMMLTKGGDLYTYGHKTLFKNNSIEPTKF